MEYYEHPVIGRIERRFTDSFIVREHKFTFGTESPQSQVQKLITEFYFTSDEAVDYLLSLHEVYPAEVSDTIKKIHKTWPLVLFRYAKGNNDRVRTLKAILMMGLFDVLNALGNRYNIIEFFITTAGRVTLFDESGFCVEMTSTLFEYFHPQPTIGEFTDHMNIKFRTLELLSARGNVTYVIDPSYNPQYISLYHDSILSRVNSLNLLSEAYTWYLAKQGSLFGALYREVQDKDYFGEKRLFVESLQLD